MIKRRGRFGEFLGCSGYSIKNEKGEPSCSTHHQSRQAGQPAAAQAQAHPHHRRLRKVRQAAVLRDGKRGPFLGCSSFPKCRWHAR